MTNAGDVSADVVIVGAGIAGAGLAAALAGHRRVVLLEAGRQPGEQATGRSAAVFVPNYGDAVVRALTAAGAAVLRQPDPAYWPSPLLRRRGLLRLVTTAGRAAYERQMAAAVGVVPVSLDEALRLFPLLRPQAFECASFEADVHDIDVHALLQGYLRAARAGGAQLRVEAPLLAAERRRGRWRLSTPQGVIEAAVVVNAAGGWADAVAALAGVAPMGLATCRRSMAVVRLGRMPDDLCDWPFVVPFPLGWYAKPEAGCLLVSPGDADPQVAGDAYADDLVLAEGLHRFEQQTTANVLRVERSWAGLRTFARDGRPVVGFDTRVAGFFWLAGQGGAGIQTAPAVSALAASLLTGGEVALPVSSAVACAVSPSRFDSS